VNGPDQALHAELTGLLTDHVDPDGCGGQRAIAQAMLAFLAARPDALHRSCLPGHFTASALVVDPSRDAVLLTLHRRLGLWLQMGGHFEAGDQSIVDAARREAVEEGGIPALTIPDHILDLDVHEVFCSIGAYTRHLDIRFLAITEAGAEPAISDESLDLRWFHREELPTPIGEDVPTLVQRAFTRLAASR
jgi:8-oxo-dGTP pyrophosphatase MutT (NUDIX family)